MKPYPMTSRRGNGAHRLRRDRASTRLILQDAHPSAVETLRRDETYRTSSRRFLAASLAQLGRLDEAQAEVELFLVANPHFSTRDWAATEPFRDDAMREHFVDGFRKAGLPA